MTPAQTLLQTHLRELGIDTTPEFRFCMERRFAFDLYDAFHRIGFECDGGQWSGGHMRGRKLENQYEKDRLAQLKGYRILRFTNREILNGSAKAWIGQHLLGLPSPSCKKGKQCLEKPYLTVNDSGSTSIKKVQKNAGRGKHIKAGTVMEDSQ